MVNGKKFFAQLSGSGDLDFAGEADEFVLNLNGAGDVSASDLEARETTVSLKGSGDVRVSSTRSMTISVAGAGDVHASGKAEKLAITIARTGDVSAFDLTAREVAVTIPGLGDASVHATERLNVEIRGQGDVHYRGRLEVKKVIRGAGKVTKG